MLDNNHVWRREDHHEVELPLASYEEANFKVADKKFKALKFVMSGLGPSDKRKVLSSKTAKEKWDVLEKIHQGSGM